MTDSMRRLLRYRPRRLRRTPAIRSMMGEVGLEPRNLINPLFVTFGRGVREPIPSMPGVLRWSVDLVAREASVMHAAGIPAVLLFGIPERKDARGTGAYAEDGVVQEAVRAIKREAPELVVITDVCLCEYTDHGHCGIIEESPNETHGHNSVRDVSNDKTLTVLEQIALSHARAGADMVAPSGMMDGMVLAIRSALDGATCEHVSILSYAAKYASAFYGPFRDAADGAPQFGDRRSYQMDPRNVREAMREIALDVEEGADIIMVKPALAYGDVIRRAREHFPHVHMAAYNVSGEYAMVKAAAEKGWIDERATVLEMLTGMRRAGADFIVSYHAKDVALWLGGD